MSAYRTVVVGTDGSDSSLRAVEKAGNIAGADAKLIVATAYLPQHEDPRAADALKDESYKVSGSAPIYAILREARDRAQQREPRTSRSGRLSAPRLTPWWVSPRKWTPICWSSATSASARLPAVCWDPFRPMSRGGRKSTY